MYFYSVSKGFKVLKSYRELLNTNFKQILAPLCRVFSTLFFLMCFSFIIVPPLGHLRDTCLNAKSPLYQCHLLAEAVYRSCFLLLLLTKYNQVASNDLFCFNLDEVITNASSAIDAKYNQIALRSVLVHKPLNLR